MRHTIVVEVPDNANQVVAGLSLKQAVERERWLNVETKVWTPAKVVEYHCEQLTIADVTDALATEVEQGRPAPDLAGVFWAGDGHEVQRGDEEERFPGDMEAAIHVARVTDCRWLLYVEGEGETPWKVLACSSEIFVRGELKDYQSDLYGDDLHAFYFDGRLDLGALDDGPDGVGYRLKSDA